MLRLRAERKKRGMSLLRLYDLTRIDPSVLSRVEREKLPAFPAWRRKIAEALKMSEEELFSSEDSTRVEN